MALTLQDIRDFVRGHLDVEVEDLPDTVLDMFIREGFNRITLATKRWPWMDKRWALDTVADQATYDLSTLTDVREITAIRSESWDLKWIGRDDADRAWPPTTTQSSEPTHYYVENDVLYLFPTPSAVFELSIRGIRKATDWIASGAGGEPDMPDELHNTVATWALARSYAQQDDPEMAQMYERQFADEMGLFLARLRDTPSSQPLVLASGRPSGVGGRLRFDWEF